VEAEPLLSFQSVSMSTGSRLSELAQYRWQSILEASMDALVGADAEGNVTWWSRRAAQMFGYEETEILGNSLQLLMPERYRALHQEGMERHQFGGAGEDVETFGRIYEVSGLRKNKKEFPIELSVSKFMVDGKPYFTAVIRDLSSFSYSGPGALLNRSVVHQKNMTALASEEGGTHFLREQRSNSTRAVGVSTIAISSAFQHIYGLRDNTRIYEDELTTIIGRSLGKYHMNFSVEKKQTLVSSLLNAAQVEGRR
jgi:PAS domain S-box-containing protein